MSLSEAGKDEKKLKAIRRAQFRLAQRLEAIDWEFDVLAPEVARLKKGESVDGLRSGITMEFEAVDVTPRIEASDANHSQGETAVSAPDGWSDHGGPTQDQSEVSTAQDSGLRHREPPPFVSRL